MGRKLFRNQDVEQVLSHLKHFLKEDSIYNLKIDPLYIHFEIDESLRRGARKTNSKEYSNELSNMSKKQRKQFNLKRRRSRPKIRTVKKGRTVSLKGVVNY